MITTTCAVCLVTDILPFDRVRIRGRPDPLGTVGECQREPTGANIAREHFHCSVREDDGGGTWVYPFCMLEKVP